MRFFQVILSLLLFAPLLQAAPPPFDELGDDEREELRRELQSIYVLGDSAADRPTVLSMQADQLESIWGQPDQIPRLFEWSSLVIDQAYAFDLILSSEPETLESLYLQLRPGSSNIGDLIRRLRIEREEKNFRARFPVFSDAQIFPSLNRDQIRFLYPSLDAEVRFPLSFEDYSALIAWRYKTPRANAELLQSYLRYLSLGNPDWTKQLPSKESFEQQLESSLEKVKELAEDQSIFLDSLESTEFIDQTDFLYSLLAFAHGRKWDVREQRRWRWTLDDIDRVSALLWFEFNFRNKWPQVLDGIDIEELRIAIQTGLRPPALEELYQRIRFELGTNPEVPRDLRDNVLIALEQVRSGSWQHADFRYLELPPLYRGVVSLLLFPQLSIEQGRALLEMKVFELDLEAKAAILNMAFPTVPSYQEWQEELQEKDVTSLEDKLALHARLVQALFDASARPISSLELLQAETDRVIVGDKILPTRSAATKSAREYLTEHPDAWNDSIYPDWLLDTLHINLFPYPGYLSDEWRKFVQSYWLTKPARELSDDWEAVYYDDSLAPELQQEQLVELSAELQEIFFDKNGMPREDYSSPSIYLAHFLGGATPGVTEGLASAGFGTGFFVVSRIAGFKIVAFYMLASGGVHLVTTWAMNEDTRRIEEWDLSKGYSPPPGRWLAEALLLLPRLLEVSLLDPSASRRLRALEDLGRLSSEFALFGVGHKAAGAFLPFNRMALVRRQHFANKQLAGFERNRVRGQRMLRQAQRELAENTAAIEAYGSRSSKQRRNLMRKRRDLLREIGQIQTGFGSRVGFIGFFAQQTGRLILRTGDALLIFLPGKGKSPIRRGGIRGFLRSSREYWSRGRHLGLPQLEELARSVRNTYAKHERRQIAGSMEIDDLYKTWKKAAAENAAHLQAVEGSIRSYLQRMDDLAGGPRIEIVRKARAGQKHLERTLDEAEQSLQSLRRQAAELSKLQPEEVTPGLWDRRAHRAEAILRRDASAEQLLELDLRTQQIRFSAELWTESLAQASHLRTQLSGLPMRLETGSAVLRQSSVERLLRIIDDTSREIRKMERAQAHELTRL